MAKKRVTTKELGTIAQRHVNTIASKHDSIVFVVHRKRGGRFDYSMRTTLDLQLEMNVLADAVDSLKAHLEPADRATFNAFVLRLLDDEIEDNQ